MKDIRWLAKNEILILHAETIIGFGGPHGLRDDGLLESALHRPKNRRHYEPEASLFALAAAYAFGLAKNHPFEDGNKRIAYLAIRSFLHRNGVRFEPDEADAVEVIVNLARGSLSEAALAVWIEENSRLR